MSNTISKISELIASKDLSQFIGIKEGLNFDAKDKMAYKQDNISDKFEIAKDVSSFANADGGYIIIGLHTKSLIEENTEEVDVLQLMAKADFSVDYWLDIINSFIHPEIRDIKIGWVEEKNNKDIGLFYIYVPKQDNDKKYFLIKTVNEEGVFLKKIVFGLAIRDKSNTNVKTINQIYQMIKKGAGSDSERLDRIENKLDLIFESGVPIVPQKNSLDKLKDRIKEIENW